jgi:hypothetical protein
LRAALDNPVVLVSLSIPQPGVDWSQLLSELPSKDDVPIKEQIEAIRRISDRLEGLVRALDGMLVRPGKPTGRPKEEVLRNIVRAGCIVWYRAGRSESYSNWDSFTKNAPAEEHGLRGPLIKFLRHLFGWCKVEAEDEALHFAIKAARSDPSIQRLAVPRPRRG